ncbi:MAG: S26 family signal peptidase [Chloroflexi bacterium]|nr:S26 family signal peptidase [Chloroflexota bacterium]
MELCYCDGRWLLETDCQALVIDVGGREHVPAAQVPMDVSAMTPPTWRLTCSTPVKLTQLRVLRDLYLQAAGPNGAGLDRAASLQAEGYYVLGDNVPISLDSRGALGRISLTQVLGRVLK